VRHTVVIVFKKRLVKGRRGRKKSQNGQALRLCFVESRRTLKGGNKD